MNIKKVNYNGSGKWITAGETKPERDGDTLLIKNALWKTNNSKAEIESIIVYNSDNLASIVVGYRYCGKYRGGSQYWQYYRYNDIDQNWNRVFWKQLDDNDRLKILDALQIDCMPNWINIPGKITTEYVNNPNNPHAKIEMDNAGTIIAYKYLHYDENNKQFNSPITSYGAIWKNNSITADQIPSDDNTNGIYAAKTYNSPILQDYSRHCNVKLVKLLLSGRVIEFRFGYRAEHADILEVLS
jgi:hypothetical protein